MAGPEVKVRLSAEGVQEVVAAFRQIARESVTAGTKSHQAFSIVNSSLSTLKGLLPAISAAAAVAAVRRLANASLELTSELKDAAAQLGITTDFLQEIRYAAIQTGTPLEVLNQGLSYLEQRIVDAAQKGEPLIKFMDGTTISATNADGSVRSLQDVLEDIVRVFPQVAKGAEQTALAADLVGMKFAARMVPLLAQGSEGLTRLSEEAHETGSVLEKELIEKGGRLNDELKLLATRLEVAFASGLFDFDTSNIDRLHEIFTDPTLLEGVRDIGVALRETFRIAGSAVRGIIALAEINGRFIDGARPVADILSDLAEAEAQASGERDSLLTEKTKRKVAAAQAGAVQAPGGGLVVVDLAAEAKAEAARRKAEAAAEKAARDAEREAQARAAAQRATEEFEARLLEQQGHRHEAELAALDIELAKYRENLEARKDLDKGEIDRRVEAARKTGEQLAEFHDLQEKADSAFSELSARRAEIEEQVARGQISEQEGEAKIIALDRERIGNLTAILDRIIAIAKASGDPAQIQAAEALAASVGRIRVEADKTGKAVAEMRKGFADAAENELAQFFTDIGTGAKSAGEALKDLITGFEKDVISLISKQLAKQLISSIFGGASSGGGGGLLSMLGGILGIQKAAGGGRIRGPGTGTSDSIPALLSDGEFVVRSKVVSQPGALDWLEHFNKWGLDMPPIKMPKVRRFRDGGLAGGGGGTRGGGAAAGGTLKVEFDPSYYSMTFGEAMERILATERWKS